METQMKVNIKKWEIWGAVVSIIAGSALHFVFEWLGGWKPVALIAAVNESTWEHLKLAFWPMLIFAIFEYIYFGKMHRNFLVAKVIALFASPIIIVAMFYSYLAITGKDNFIFDISTFAVAVILGYVISYFITISEKGWSKDNVMASLLLIIIISAFCLFTYFPPKNFLFLDPVDKTYGIK